MTGERLHILFCNVFEPEVRALPEGQFADVTFSFFDNNCHAPRPERSGIDALLKACPDCTRGKVVGGSACLRRLGPTIPAPYPVETVLMQQCLQLVAPRGVLEREQADGAYCVSPGWLAHWETEIEKWGVNRENAGAMFGDGVRRVVLLDTRVDPDSRKNLEAFAAAVKRPSAVVPVGLGHFETTLKNILRAADPSRRGTPIKGIEPSREQTDFALAMDLLGDLFGGLLSENDAFQGIMDSVRTLYAPDHVRVLAVRPQKADILHVHGEPAPQVASEAVRNHFLACTGTHMMTGDGAGFLFRLSLGGDEIGIVEVSRVAIPAAITNYLSLALAIAPVCAAVVASARAYDDAREARTQLDRANTALQSANDDLAAVKKELDKLHDVLPVCAWCNSILDEKGAWTRLSEYLQAYTGSHFSHGICANCQAKFFDEPPVS
jgi:hypothetical protein